jgi:DNA polymerase
MSRIDDPKRFLAALLKMGIEEYVSGGEDRLTLARIKAQSAACTKCGLAASRRTVVFGEGSETARVVFVGEAPGEEEDRQGRPFVGRAGKLLDKMIESIGLRRRDVYICNVLKCRPPGNRDPEPAEVEACKEYLAAQLEAINPLLICTLGKHAYNTLLGVDARITKIRGRLTDYKGIKLLPTYHPSFLLRNQGAMGDAYDDMQKVKSLLSG